MYLDRWGDRVVGKDQIIIALFGTAGAPLGSVQTVAAFDSTQVRNPNLYALVCQQPHSDPPASFSCNGSNTWNPDELREAF